MYIDPNTYIKDAVPVSVTMEDDNPKDPGRPNRSNSDSTQDQSARLLQVTMATEVDVIDTREDLANNGKPATAITAPATDDDYILQSPNGATNDSGSIEAQLQQDLQGLTGIERQQVHCDIRGEVFRPESSSSAEADIDSNAKQQTDLESLNRELFRLLEDPSEQEKNPLYTNISKTLSSSGSDFYANSVGFRTKLLRAACGDIPKAAKRTADYLSLLWESFGEPLLSRPIVLLDLSPSERQLQRKGYQQLFRFRDQSRYRRQASEEQQQDQQENPQFDQSAGAGRRIAGSFDLCRCDNSAEPAMNEEISKIRVLLYLMQVASDDEETQKLGIVFIFMLALRAVLTSATTNSKPQAAKTQPSSSEPTSGAVEAAKAGLPRKDIANIFENDTSSDSDNHSDAHLLEQLQFSPQEYTQRHNHTMTRVKVLSKVFRCCLVRVAAIHVCSPARKELQQLKLDFLRSLDLQERVRTKFHDGTSMECSLSLNKVGIPTDRLPLKYDGTIKTEDHLQWIAIQEAKELAIKQNRVFDIVECPMNMDILSGRGQLVRSHPGNVSFRKDFIRARSTRYDRAANREEKNSIADEILGDIKTLKRKFLKQHQGAGYWVELDKKTAKEKVMMAFREFRKSQRNQLQQKNKQSPTPRPTMTLSQSVPHSPVTQAPTYQRPSSMPSSMSKPMRGHPDEVAATGASLQQQQQQPQHNADFPYPLYTTSGVLNPGEMPPHPPLPPHQLAGMPPMPPYFLPHPPAPHQQYGYGHPMPPHLLPPPPHGHPPSGDSQEATAAAAASYSPQVPTGGMGYPPPHHLPPNYLPTPIHPDLGPRLDNLGGMAPQQQHMPGNSSNNMSDTGGQGDPNERSYKRHRFM